MSGFETVIYEKKDGIGTVTLNRPEIMNVYNIRMRDELVQVLAAIRDDDEVRVGIFQGAGERAFCAGADLNDFLSAPTPCRARQIRWERDVWGLLLNVPQPLIASLHGYVLGSGLEIALFCDLRITSDSAVFGLPEVALGIIPAAGGTQTLPRIVGQAKALEILLTHRWIGAKEAHRIGLVNRWVPKENLTKVVRAMAKKLAALDPSVLRRVKKAVAQGLDLPLEAGLKLERRLAICPISQARRDRCGSEKVARPLNGPDSESRSAAQSFRLREER